MTNTQTIKRDSAGAVDVVRYWVSPNSKRVGWHVKGVRLAENGREIGNDPINWIYSKTKREARQIAGPLNKELKRLGRFVKAT